MTNGRTGYVMYMPVFRTPPQSLLSLGIDAVPAFAVVVGDMPATYAISIVDATAAAAGAPEAAPNAGVLLYTAGGEPAASAVVSPATATYNFLNRTWVITISPTPAFVDGVVSPGQRYVAAVGVPLVIVGGARAIL
jgi:hypothetical protein